MTARRKLLLLLLLPVLALPFVGRIGIIELILGVGVMTVWLMAFFTWGRHHDPATTAS